MAYNPINLGPTTTANSQAVVLPSDQVAIPVTGPLTDTQLRATAVAVSLATLPSLAAGSNAIGSITNTGFNVTGTLPAFAATPTFNIGTIGTIATESTLSTLNGKIPSNLTVTSTRLLVDGSGVTQPVTLVAATTGGDTTYHLVSPAGTNAANIVTGQRKVTGWYIYNSNASARKVNLYNINVAPTMGTTVPTLAIVIPGLAAANVSFPTGLDFSTGISISTVTDLTDLGITGVGLNDLIINLFYK